MFVIYYLIAMCVFSGVNACLLSCFYRRPLNTYFTAFFFSIVLADFGYLFLALSTTIEGAIVANKVCYLGACFLPLFLFLLICRLCSFDLSRWIKLLMFLYSAFVFALSCTVGFSDVFYESVRYVVLNGFGSYMPTYGPGHVLWDFLLYFYMVANVVVIVVAAKKKRNVSYKTLIAIAGLAFVSIGAFILTRNLENDTLLMPLVYLIDELVLLYICALVKMHDVMNSVLESLEAENTAAYLAFSPKGQYLGCNDIASRYFPELLDCRVDHALPSDIEIEGIFKEGMEQLKGANGDKVYRFTYKDRYFKAVMRNVRQNKKLQIFLFRIEDETNIQRYIERLDANNTELAALIKNNKDQIRLFQNQMLVGMAEMVNNKDGFTGAHLKRTKEVVSILVSKMQKDPDLNYSKEFYDDMIAAAPMHDIGKIAIDDHVLCKPGKFTPEEFDEMKTHAEKGAIIIKNLLSNFQSELFVEIAKNMAGGHHERWDGSGYPYGLKGEAIPLEARVMAVADVYDALVSKRCYKEAFSFDDAYDIIDKSMGKHFDPNLKKYFDQSREELEEYYRKECEAERAAVEKAN
ncbi:HD domain-containing phosphohydrolase [Fibrobacter sp. UWB13]|uniref:HD domain-containing phosphohydrolase n=1 Tax=Fibrobacter sp. UWB13 TaxID=1896204 RepID=UPI000A097042|nr:HD domain-containing phosphohydrolase [Fibrobacter sp. UWB13]SMG44729.1 N-terminal 7TM region of histidine kinase [Fibrobacter sp. UWB13]